jgi:hypothetical protein
MIAELIVRSFAQAHASSRPLLVSITRQEAAPMQTLRTFARADADGVLHLDIPAGTPESEYEVVVVIQPRAAEPRPGTPAERGWPPRFFDETAGAWQGEFVRDQGRGVAHRLKTRPEATADRQSPSDRS